MKPRRKAIQLLLLDGEANGRIKCTMANWTGLAFKIPRTALDKCKDRNDLNRSGVYFLFGSSDDTEEKTVYIGQAGLRKNKDGLLNRLQEHKRNPSKDYWSEAIVFTTSNNSFGPTEISYLENRFCNMAINAKRYIVKNGNEPNPGNLTEEKECELEEFVDYAKIIIGTLSHKVFIPLNEISITKHEETNDNQEPLMYLETSKVCATGNRTSEGFIVYKNSTIASAHSPKCTKNLITLRNKHFDKIDKYTNKTTEDILFSSPSYAAAFVVYRNANGLLEWKTDSGKTLKDLENED
jgi:hypothetical protein